MTNGRRSSPVPQLKCVGGTAGCHAFQPKVVQCINRGSDGYDVQWECKTEMDSAYRFGQIQVSCEGYDYPDDPYVLRGSCGVHLLLLLCILCACLCVCLSFEMAPTIMPLSLSAWVWIGSDWGGIQPALPGWRSLPWQRLLSSSTT